MAASAVFADTITTDVFSITQTGYTSLDGSLTGTLTGTFTGVVNGVGYIPITGISQFDFTLNASNGYSSVSLGKPSFFSFSTGTDGKGAFSSLAFAVVASPFDEMCVGAAAGLLAICNPNGVNLPSPTNGIDNVFTTPDIATGYLVSTTITQTPPPPHPTPAPSAAPEPDVWVLMLIGLGVVGGQIRTRRSRGDPRLFV